MSTAIEKILTDHEHVQRLGRNFVRSKTTYVNIGNVRVDEDGVYEGRKTSCDPEYDWKKLGTLKEFCAWLDSAGVTPDNFTD